MKAICNDRFQTQKVESFTLVNTYGETSFFSNPPSNVPSRSDSTSNQKANQPFNKAELEAKLKKILESEVSTSVDCTSRSNLDYSKNDKISTADLHSSFSFLTEENEEKELLINPNQSYEHDDPLTKVLHISFSSLTQDNEEKGVLDISFFEFDIVDCSGKNNIDN